MALTKLEAKELIRELLDDASSRLWSDTLLERLVTTTLDRLWGEVLSFAPRFTSKVDTIATLQAPGYIRLALTTDTPAGDLTSRFFRVQSVVRGNQEYAAADPRNIVVNTNGLVVRDTSREWVYHIQDRQLWVFPLDTEEDMELRYSFLPPKYSGLANGDPVQWPEGLEDAYVYEAAGRAMLKGGREDATALLAIGREAMADVRAYVSRPHGGVITPFQHMTAQSWGGE